MKEETKIRVANKLVKNEFINVDPLKEDAWTLPRLPMVFVVNEEDRKSTRLNSSHS